MAIISYRANGATSNLERVFLYKDSGATAGTEGDPILSISAATSGLIISTICDNEASPTTYTALSSNIETATAATYAAPTAGKCRIVELDSVNLPGCYELQFADARYAVTSAKFLDIVVTGATDLATTHCRVFLDVLDEAGLRSAIGLASANLDTQLGNIPTVTEFEARTLTSSDYSTFSQVDGLGETLSDWQTGVSKIYANVDQVRGQNLTGTGTSADPWGPA